MPHDMPERMDGFARHAPEFQTLASLMLDKVLDTTNRSMKEGKVGITSNPSFLGDVSELISRAQETRVPVH